jgi:hypothetical protein
MKVLLEEGMGIKYEDKKENVPAEFQRTFP